MTRAKATFLAIATLLGSASPAIHARAQDNTAAAESLFQDGRKLAEAGHYAEACPKFAASQKLAPAVGTLLNLGDCYQQNGQTATAWATFRQAISAAQRANRPDREKLARERAAALDGKLVKMTISAPGRDPKFEVKVDGNVVDPAVLGSSLPVDPGKHMVEASAPGKKPWSQSVIATLAHSPVVVEIPVLEDAATAAVPPKPDAAPAGEEPRAPEESEWGPQRIGGVALAGAGVVALGLGAVFGLNAKSKWSDAQSHCVGTVCDAAGVSLAQDAHSAGNVSTVLFVVAGAALAGGAALYLTSPKPRSAARLRVAPTVAGLVLAGGF